MSLNFFAALAIGTIVGVYYKDQITAWFKAPTGQAIRSNSGAFGNTMTDQFPAAFDAGIPVRVPTDSMSIINGYEEGINNTLGKVQNAPFVVTIPISPTSKLPGDY